MRRFSFSSEISSAVKSTLKTKRKMTRNRLSLAWLLIIVSSFDSPAAMHTGAPGDSTKCPDRCTCSTHFKMINCEYKQLKEIPKGIPVTATELFLGFNELAEIDTGSFSTLTNLTELSLKNNQIRILQNRSFVGLRNLKILTLRKNKLVSIVRDAFWDLISLQRLYLTDNLLTLIPDLTFTPDLIYLTVDTNFLESASLCSSKSTNLAKLSTLKLPNNVNLTRILSDDFKCVSRLSLRSIDIARCRVATFGDDVFRFPHLQSLSFSYNSIPYDMLRRIFHSFSTFSQSDLASLDLSGVLQPIDLLPSDLFADLAGTRLDHLSLAHTSKVSVIQNGTFQYLPHLKYLDLSYSEFTEIFDDSLSRLTNLERISLNHNRKLSSVPKLNISSLKILELNNNPQIEQLNKGTFAGLISLTNLTIQSCRIRTIITGAFNGLANLESLNLAGNLIAGIPGRTFIAMHSLAVLDLSFNRLAAIPTQHDLFVGLSGLQRLDFSNNYCVNVSRRIFHPLISLTHLNLAGNLLGEVVSKDTDGQLFHGLKQLEHLRLDDNKLPILPNRLLVGPFNNLTFLNLSNNHLTAWPQGMINKSTPLDVIHLASNTIATVTEGELTTLPDHTRLNLTANPFACDCDLIWFGRWIAKQNVSDGRLVNLSTYKCYSPDSMAGKPLVQFNPDDIESSCHQLPLKWILTGACSGLVVFMLVCVIVTYRYRWSLRLRLYYLSRMFKSPSDDRSWQNEIDGFDYDVFVSYGPSDRDRNWVKTELMPRFERNNAIHNTDEQPDNDNDDNNDNNDVERQPLMHPDGPDGDGPIVTTEDSRSNPLPPVLGKWRVFMEEEEATFGQLEFNTLAESIFKSRKLVLVVSDEYLSDGRRQIEIELGVQSRIENRLGFDSIIVVFLEQDADVKATRTLRCIVDSKDDRLYWPEDDSAGQELFWRQLAEAIQSRPDVALLSP